MTACTAELLCTTISACAQSAILDSSHMESKAVRFAHKDDGLSPAQADTIKTIAMMMMMRGVQYRYGRKNNILYLL